MNKNLGFLSIKDVPNLEACPKWEALLEVLDEIGEHNNKADKKYGPGRVLIAAEDDRTCAQIREVLADIGILSFLWLLHLYYSVITNFREWNFQNKIPD